MSFGNSSACTSGDMRPSNVGPSRIPAVTSPITRGCPIRTATLPSRRAESMTMATAMKKAAKVWPASRCFAAANFSPVAPSAPSAGVRVMTMVRSAASPFTS